MSELWAILVFPVTIVRIFAVSLWHPLLVSQPVWTTTKMLSTVVEDNCVPNLILAGGSYV